VSSGFDVNENDDFIQLGSLWVLVGRRELSPILGDGLKDQSAAIWD
jgi:hypothetical protein